MTDQHNKANEAIVVTEPARLVQEDPGHTLAPVVSAILAQNPTAEALGQLMALQERWEDREAARAFSAARVRLRAALPPVIAKDKVVSFESKRPGVPGTHYTHLSLAHLMRVVTPHLSEHGFDLTHETEVQGAKVRVTAVLTHSMGHSKSTTLEAPIDTSGNKSPAQGVASTVTLLTRYTSVALLGLATDDMEEPHGPREDERPAAPTVDQAANIAAAAWIRRQGYNPQDAEGYLERRVADWTSDDLTAVRSWVKVQRDARKKAAASPPPVDADYELSGDEVRQPGDDDDAQKTGGRTK